MAYMAGFLEGVLTGELIYMQFANTFGKDYCLDDSGDNRVVTPCPEFCDELNDFLDTNLMHLLAEIEMNPESDYWYQVRRRK